MAEELGRYHILEEIGQGGFAVVYRAHDRQLDRPVALKELKPTLLNDPASIDDFQREARNIARLDHPQVVTIFDVVQVAQRQFIVMQLVDGSSLGALITRQGQIPWPEAVEIITALAAGLDYAHSQNILHRDLKPANILLDSKHGPMLSDFGLAKLMGEAGRSATAAGNVVGTPHYIAPEVWEGQGSSRQSDIYALGCILFEMLTGQKLFPGNTPPAVMMAHFKALSLPQGWPEGVPPGVAAVLATALAQRPADRYASASEMVQALGAPPRQAWSATPQPEPVRPAPQLAAPPILTTKLYSPPTRPEFVPRPRLVEQLDQGLRSGRRLTVISAPAGFGKTTLVSSWINNRGEGSRPKAVPGQPAVQPTAPSLHPANVAWLSLDEGDNDATRFLTYFVAALQTIAANAGDGALGLLHSPQQPPIESILTALLNGIAAIPHNFALVLDDYHVINAQPVDQALTFLLEYLPPHMHLIITTREDPALPLARYRARGQLTELRAADLRFTADEAATFFNQALALGLSAEEVASLESRTEGWIAGLQLAALSMQGRGDVTDFIKAFAGDNRYIVDYLVEEVLQHQPPRVRNFLLQTSILGRLSGPLCDAVTGQTESAALLDALERGNLFIVPLDDKRQWYRYHHLFADVLLAHALQEQPDAVPALHQRASAWYERAGSPGEAIHHAAAANNPERVADLAELAWPAMDGRFQSATWLSWVQPLPDKLARTRPVLCVAYAWAHLNDGQLEAGEAWLRDAERWLNPATAADKPAGGMVVVDDDQFRTLPASIATARAYHAQALGDVAATIAYTQQALDLLPETDHLQRGPAAALQGIAYWTSGKLEAAHRALTAAMASFYQAGSIVFALSGTYGLADIRIAQGRLRDAVRTYEQALLVVAKQSEARLPGTADLYLGLAGLHLEQGRLDAAARHLQKSRALGEPAALPDWPCRMRVVQARFKQIQGDPDGALALLDEAERLYYRTPIPEVRPISALKARVWLEQGRLAEAWHWARRQALSVDDDLSYLHEFEHITLARLLLAQHHHDRTDGSIEQATTLLARLLTAAENGDRLGSIIEILVLQALAQRAQGSGAPALAALERALALAEPEGFARVFVDAGPPLAGLLSEIVARGAAPDYITSLLAQFPDFTAGVARAHKPQSALVEPLSERELEVLRLVAEGLSNREISERLFLALDTVKGHNRRIYGKLQVQRRTEAIARARELGLL